MPTEFSETLVRLRKAADFPSAYAFYHDNGGQAVFQLSYRKYQLIEKGDNLPKPERLSLFISLLRFPPRSPEANALALAWMRTFFGPELFKSTFAPLLSEKLEPAQATPTREVLSQALRGKRVTITPTQYQVVAKSFEHYWAYTILSDSADGCATEDLARCLRAAPAKTAQALKELCRAGVVKEIRKGVFHNAYVGMVHVSPAIAALPELRQKTAAYVRRMAERGKVCTGRRIVMQADETQFGQFFSFFNDSVRSAQAYIDTERSPRSAYFMVEGRIVKLFQLA